MPVCKDIDGKELRLGDYVEIVQCGGFKLHMGGNPAGILRDVTDPASVQVCIPTATKYVWAGLDTERGFYAMSTELKFLYRLPVIHMKGGTVNG